MQVFPRICGIGKPVLNSRAAAKELVAAHIVTCLLLSAPLQGLGRDPLLSNLPYVDTKLSHLEYTPLGNTGHYYITNLGHDLLLANIHHHLSVCN